MPRYLGCNLIRNEAATDLVTLESRRLPQQLSDLASREELSRWLTRILLYTIVPGHGGLGDAHVSLPNNLVAFIDLLVYLHSVRFQDTGFLISCGPSSPMTWSPTLRLTLESGRFLYRIPADKYADDESV